MKAVIATVVNLEGTVSAVDTRGQKRELSVGESLFLDDVVKTGQQSAVQLQVNNTSALKLESLQSMKLSSDISPEHMSEQSDAVLNVNLPEGIVEQLFSIYPLDQSSILTEIEPVYDIERLHFSETEISNVALELGDILQSAQTSECLEQYLRFDQESDSTVIYFSQNGDFIDSSNIESHADKVLSISSVGYSSSAELLSFLLESYLVDDQS